MADRWPHTSVGFFFACDEVAKWYPTGHGNGHCERLRIAAGVVELPKIRLTISCGDYVPFSLDRYPHLTRFAVQHAPAGGITIAGKQFKGGEFIPAEVLEKASPEQKAALSGKLSRQDIVASAAKAQSALGADYQRAKEYANRTLGRAYTKLERQPWQTAATLTAKDRFGKVDVAKTSRQLKELKDMGAVRVGWDLEGNAYWALAHEELPAHLLSESDVETLESEGWTIELAKALLEQRK